jgi:hypothetical protein
MGGLRRGRGFFVLALTSLALGGCSDDAASDGQGGGGAGSPSTTSSSGAGGAGGDAASCGEPVVLTTSALAFDGTAGVTMGPAPDLGADEFTLAAWVRRDGLGSEASTGVGGIRHVPLITKGRGEADGTNVDCNYALGLVGDVLGADFEDFESGENHPVIGKTPLERGRWHHVAATYDGARFRLYVDGELDADLPLTATPRYDSIQHFGLGVAINSLGATAGGFVGAMDEVRVYSRALEAVEIQSSMFASEPGQLGLIGHFRLEASDGEVLDASGNDNHGAGIAAGFVTPGPVLDLGHAPTLGSLASEALPNGNARLSVEASDLDADAIYVDFYARELTQSDDFTIAVLPDSQYYTRNASPPERPVADDPDYFYAQTRWAVENRISRNVIGVFHVGDIINNADVTAQWLRADNAFEILEAAADPALPHGIAYGLSFGNHDQFPRDEPGATTVANQYFGPSRFAGRAYYGGNFDGTNDESWVRFQAGDLEVVVVNLQFNPAPSAAVLAWARRVFETHPRALGIVNSHYIVTTGGNFSTQGQAIYDALKDVPNVQLMASGHVAVDARRTDEFEGNVIHSMLSDYQRTEPDPSDPDKPLIVEQSLTNGGHGFMRSWRFSPRDQKLYVESFSPKLGLSYTDDRNQFELDVELVGAGRGFEKLGTVPITGGEASLELLGAAGKTHEWYAVASDCVHETKSELSLTK